MSGLYLSGMEMPTGCGAVTLKVWPDGQVEVFDEDGEWKVVEAVPVPEHGDLKDTDALRHWILTEMASLDTEEDREFVADRLANELPTVIPADPVKEGEG